MKCELVSSLADVNRNEWDSLNTSNHPFTSYDFLNSLEMSESVTAKTGWNPQHIIIKNNTGNIIGASPNYLKMHSYGEYIFDHAWANAFENAGGQYYPKLLSAIPFTPATGPRILIDPKNPDNNKLLELYPLSILINLILLKIFFIFSALSFVLLVTKILEKFIFIEA